MSKFPSLSLWWSLIWRLTVPLFLFNRSTMTIGWSVTLGLFDPALDFGLRITATWWAISVLLWVAAAAAPRFVGALVWGERLRLGASGWRAVGRALSLTFFGLGLVNWVLWEQKAAELWVQFRFFAPVPIHWAVLAIVAVVLTKSNRKAN